MNDITVQVTAGINLMLSHLIYAQKISEMIQSAAAEGRAHFTVEEWQSIVSLDDRARENLAMAIESAKRVGA